MICNTVINAFKSFIVLILGREITREKEYRDKDYPFDPARDYPPLDRDQESDYHWRRDRDSYKVAGREFEPENWERYHDKHLDYPATKPDTYRRLPQRPQSYAAAETTPDSQQFPRRKLPQIPVRGSTRPSSYVQSTRFNRSFEEQPPQYHSNPHLSIGGPLPTHYESYYHELRSKTSPHSSLRQLPPTPSEMVTGGHRRTNSSGSFGHGHDDPDLKYPGHRFSYQEGDSALSRVTRYGLGGQRNFSSLPRNHGGAVHYKDQGPDFYRTHREVLPKRTTALVDDPAYIPYPEDRSYPHYTTSGVDDDLVESLLPRRRFPLLDDPLVNELQRMEESISQYPHPSYRDSHRFGEYLDEELTIDKTLKSPDYYDIEAKYTQMSTEAAGYAKLAEAAAAYSKVSQRISLPDESYLERSQQLHHRLSQEYVGTDPGYPEWERRDLGPSYREMERDRVYDRDRAYDKDLDRPYDRERVYERDPGRAFDRERDWEQDRDRGFERDIVPGRAGAEDHPRARMKPQLSWEQYSQDDQSDDLKYIVPDPG